MIDLLLAAGRVFFRSRADTALEVLALTPAGRRPQTETSTTGGEPARSPGVDIAQAGVAEMEGRSGHGETETVIGWHRGFP